MAEAKIQINGNLTADPELRFLPSGVAVANFTVASTPRVYDKQSGEWNDGKTVFLRVNVWRQLAEGAAEALRKGDSVVVIGTLKQDSYEKDGVNRITFEIDADDVGKSVRLKGSGGQQQAPSSGGGW